MATERELREEAEEGEMREEAAPPVVTGITEGEEVISGTERFALFNPRAGLVLEVCLAGSSAGVAPPEEWFAPGILEAVGSPSAGWRIVGNYLGCENGDLTEEVMGTLQEGFIHVCGEDPCSAAVDPPCIHATRVRLWRATKFKCGYLMRGAASALKAMALEERAAVARVSQKSQPPGQKRPGTGRTKPAGKGRGTTARAPRKRPAAAADEGVIPIPSDGEAAEGDAGLDATQGAGVRRAALRERLQLTKERILGGATPRRASRRDVDLTGGPTPALTGRAAESSALVAGTSLRPGRQTPLMLEQSADLSGGGANPLKKRLVGERGASGALLAKAVQQSALDAKDRKRKKRKKDRKDGVKQLLRLLQGKDKRRGKGVNARNKRRGRKDPMVKLDPDDPGYSGSSGGDSDSYYSDSQEDGEESGAETELEMEAPLKRKSSKEPGSVMAMLVRHAQEQLDRGALLDGQGDRAGLTTGIKISTFFALLIRPYHSPSSPLLRELYALAQAIDLLRMGRLPETADALASRFIAVHTAMTEGNWQAASQLEIFPLEPVQSATTATMLEARKHRRLILKSQGFSSGNRWWSNAGWGKGSPGQEKGKKGDGRGKGKGKGKPQNKDWGAKGDGNAWKDNKEDAGKKT